MNTVDIKERIERLLEHLNINQKEFSKKTGISENTLSHAKKGKHTPNIDFFNSIYRIIPHINAQWLYMGVGEMFSETQNNIHEAGKDFMRKMKHFKRQLKEDECNHELEKAEHEIEYLKRQVDDKNQIIHLLKNNRVS